MKKELVYCALFCRNVYAYRESNKTLLIPRHILPDTDMAIVEDRHGHRYARNIELETYIKSKQYIFTII
jgi:hypothetical protein